MEREVKSPLDNALDVKYIDNAEVALAGAVEDGSLSAEVVELIRETNAKIKEINRVEAPIAMLSNCMLFLNFGEAAAVIEALKHAIKIKMFQELKGTFKEELEKELKNQLKEDNNG